MEPSSPPQIPCCLENTERQNKTEPNEKVYCKVSPRVWNPRNDCVPGTAVMSADSRKKEKHVNWPLHTTRYRHTLKIKSQVDQCWERALCYAGNVSLMRKWQYQDEIGIICEDECIETSERRLGLIFSHHLELMTKKLNGQSSRIEKYQPYANLQKIGLPKTQFGSEDQSQLSATMTLLAETSQAVKRLRESDKKEKQQLRRCVQVCVGQRVSWFIGKCHIKPNSIIWSAFALEFSSSMLYLSVTVPK